MKLGPKIKKEFSENGFVVIKNFFSKKTIYEAKREIFFNSGALSNEKNKVEFKIYNFDYYIKKSLKKGNKFSSKFYDVSKKFLSMYNFIFNKKIINLGKYLLDTNNIGVLNRAFGYRLDKPRDKKFLTQLHQDYIQNLGAPEGLVFYNSLRDVKKIDGPVIVYKGSHKLGILKTKIMKKSFDKSRSYILNISHVEMAKFKECKLLLNKTDLAVFDFLLLHKSSTNKSKNIRWSMVSRFFSFDSKIGKKKFFPGGLQEGNKFEAIHPEKVMFN